jgi:hypothetical protein
MIIKVPLQLQLHLKHLLLHHHPNLLFKDKDINLLQLCQNKCNFNQFKNHRFNTKSLNLKKFKQNKHKKRKIVKKY